ncbi:SRF-type transcription factor RlmA [Phyllosticta citricarpa]|uniref:SRF-type transcription factor RlmA n=1 Tax=Phyllosticta citricarpa TaxID=55181 RepID=A0ABR1MNI7_9PEZI
MGRRKIEIKAIKDDRNRSVTFLKRKGGLFKKAHELSVLCSVDVAVIIFGHNKKLYEFSSGDITETIGRYQYVRQYGGAHEHKGPEDFMGKQEGDEEDEEADDAGQQQPGSHSPPEPQMLMPPHLQGQQFQHIRHTTPSGSPPVPNGVQFHQRHVSPQPPQNLSRPNSRTHIRRPSSNLAPPQQYPPPQPPAPTYNYRPNPPFYPPQPMPQQAPPGPPPQPPPSYPHPPPPPPPHPQVQQVYMQEPRRQSMPPQFAQQPPPPQPMPHPQSHPPPMTTQPLPQPISQPLSQQEHQQRQQSVVPSPQPDQHNFTSPPLPQPKPLPAAAKSSSIFTPIDDSRSVLAQHWGPSTTQTEIKVEHPSSFEPPRPQSIDVAQVTKQQHNGTAPLQPPRNAAHHPHRTVSTSSLPTIPPPARVGSVNSEAKRPRLKVQIPDEHSEAENTQASGSPKDASTTGATPARTSTEASHSSGVVLPPPSPSASALLSAGATGPPNPFARPAPPMNHSSTNHPGSSLNEKTETPISALPSRYLGDLLPSPSSFYPNWDYNSNSSNMLPSPLTFQTPVVQNGPSFRDDPEESRKRKTSEEGSDGGQNKKAKT